MTIKVEVDRERIEEMRERESFYRPYADRVNKIACDLLRQGVGFSDRKVFISDVSTTMGVPMQRLAPMLVHMSKLGWVSLTRLDLPQAADPYKAKASEIETVLSFAVDEYGTRYHLIECRQLQDNPGARSKPMKKAIDQFITFHDFEPRDVGPFPASLRMPRTATLAGDMVHVMYRSDKWHEGRSDDYIHEHESGVKVYRTDAECEGPKKTVISPIYNCRELVRIGRCLGFAYTDHEGNEVNARTDGDVQLYYIPSGRALVIVNGVRVRNGKPQFYRPKVAALIWGGKLNVEARGIVH